MLSEGIKETPNVDWKGSRHLGRHLLENDIYDFAKG